MHPGLLSVRASSMVFAMLLALLLTLAPACASAGPGDGDEEDEGKVQAALLYGSAKLKDFYGRDWEGESMKLSFSYFEGLFGLGIAMHLLDVRFDEPGQRGYYFRHGPEAVFYLAPGIGRVQAYAGLGLGAHYNYIHFRGTLERDRTGFGFRAIGEAGLRVMVMRMKAFGSPAELVIGGYGRHSVGKEYFSTGGSGTEAEGLRSEEYGGEVGLKFEL